MHSHTEADQSLPRLAPDHIPLYRNRDYLRIAVASIASATGSRLSQFALPFLALSLTQSPLWAGLLSAAQLLPYLLFSLPAGVWVDRSDRKRLLVWCDLLRAGVLVTLPLAYLSGALTIPHLLIAVFVVGTCTLLFETAELAALPQVVARAQLTRARAISEGIDAATAVAGPGLGGLIVGLGRSTLSGALLAYLVDSGSYLISALALLGVRRPLQQRRPSGRPALVATMLEGLRFVWGDRTLRLLMLLTAGVNLLQAPTSLLVILIAQQRFGLSPSVIGALFGVAGGAAVAGSLLASWWYRPERLRLVLLGSLWIWALGALLLGVAPQPWVLALGLALNNIIWPLYAVAIVSYRLAATPDALQGRVISSFRMLSYGAEPIGLALGGLVVSAVAPSLILIGVAMCLLAAALGVGLRLRQ